jgi:hypothetical protein
MSRRDIETDNSRPQAGVGWHAAPTIEEFYGMLRLATATTPNIVKAIEKRPSRAAA